MTQLNRRQFAGLTLSLGAAGGHLFGNSATTDDILRSGIAGRKIPAAVGMFASGNKILYQGAFGTRDSTGAPAKADTIFGIASMTKAITTTAALQLVEQGKVELDEPASKHLPQLAKLDVLEGFDAVGRPKLRPSKTEITLKHLLTHTSGLCYDIWDGDMFRYTSSMGGQSAPGTVVPLMFEPGSRWQYGQGIDWAGRLVEKLSGVSLEEYFQTKILAPLEMRDTTYVMTEAKFDRLASMYRRQPDGILKQDNRALPPPPKTFNGGGGLYSTVGDYVRFMQMILGMGQGSNGIRILRAKTVESMKVNQIGELTAGKMKSYRTAVSSDVDIQPGFPEKWGLGFLINTTAYPGGRSANSLAWAGIANTYYWIDPKRSRCGVLMMQFYPFVDKDAVGLLGDFERAVYA